MVSAQGFQGRESVPPFIYEETNDHLNITRMLFTCQICKDQKSPHTLGWGGSREQALAGG